MTSVMRNSSIFSGEQLGRFLYYVAIRANNPQDVKTIVQQVLPYIETGIFRGWPGERGAAVDKNED